MPTLKVTIHHDFTGTVLNFDGMSRENYDVSRNAELSRIPKLVPILSRFDHRLNGSSSPVLTATPHSYAKGQISTPHKIKTSEWIGMKSGTVDYVLEICPQNKFGDDRSSGGFWVDM